MDLQVADGTYLQAQHLAERWRRGFYEAAKQRLELRRRGLDIQPGLDSSIDSNHRA